VEEVGEVYWSLVMAVCCHKIVVGLTQDLIHIDATPVIFVCPQGMGRINLSYFGAPSRGKLGKH
jgi:hypothetical protein